MRILIVLLASALFLAPSAAAQSSPAEFGRASGGEIEAITKEAKKFSGSLAITMGTDLFSGSRGYEGSLGGTLFEDRMWFFASASRSNNRWSSPAFDAAPVSSNLDMTFGKMTAQLGDRHHLAASLGRTNGAAPVPALTVPTSFLTMRYDAAVTSSMFFSARFTRSQAAESPLRSVIQP